MKRQYVGYVEYSCLNERCGSDGLLMFESTRECKIKIMASSRPWGVPAVCSAGKRASNGKNYVSQLERTREKQSQ